LTIVPCELKQANEFVARLHRHHKPVVGHRFSIAVVNEDGCVCGVAIVGRPVARMLQDGWTVEVTRLCTDGTDNAASALYGAAWRSAKERGYRRILTYILDTEPGTTLKAAGWIKTITNKGGSWSVPSRPRIDKHPLGPKTRWECFIQGDAPAVIWPECA
jgi:hypothetical protein